MSYDAFPMGGSLLGCRISHTRLWAGPAHADEWNKKTTFKFDQPVEVPGYVLIPGQYVFRLADLTADRDVVQVFSEDQKGMDHLVTTAFAVPHYFERTPDRPIVTFEERHVNTPEAVHSWAYPGDNYGWEFVYPKSQRIQVAANTPPPVAPAPVAPAPAPRSASAPPAQSAPVATAPASRPPQQPVTIAQNKLPATAQKTPPPAEQPKTLPQTSSDLPLTAGLGTMLLALGAGILAYRRVQD